MKIRMGFVSNSSSGSFIMHWRFKDSGKKISIEKAIGMAFGVFFKDDMETIDWENTWNPEVKNKVEKAIEATVQNDDGTFVSTFWTSMINSAEDFGETAKSLVMGIVANEDNNMEIIDNKIEMDY